MIINYHAGGYVGLTGAVHYRYQGFDVVISDPDLSVVDAINAGKPKAGSFLAYSGLPEICHGFRAQQLPAPDADCHILAVPSERDGEPYMEIVEALFEKLCATTDGEVPIIIESTLMPGMAKRLRKIAVSQPAAAHVMRPWAIAPRRDWFADKDKNLTTLTRVVGRDPQLHKEIEPWITAVCRDIQWTTPETAEITKALENALLHLPVVLLHELALLFPEYDMAEAAALASTHWRFRSMGKLYLGLGTGGRCVPLGSRYLSERGGALLGDAIELDDQFAASALQEVLADPDAKDCAERYKLPDWPIVLGIAYRPGFKDAGNSPGIRVVQALSDLGCECVTVMDPYFTPNELVGLMSDGVKCVLAPMFDVRELASADLIVLTVAHPEFELGWTVIRPGTTVVDATGMWEGKRDDIRYIRPGRPGWIKSRFREG